MFAVSNLSKLGEIEVGYRETCHDFLDTGVNAAV